MAQKRLTIMLVPHSHKRIREITISQRALWLAVTALAVVIVLSLSYAIGFHIRSGQVEELNRLRKENSQLTSRIHQVSENINSLKSQMDELTHAEEMLRVLANLPETDSETRMMGIGGIYEDDKQDPDVVSYAAKMGMDIDASVEQLLRQVSFQRHSFEEIEQSFRDSIEFRQHLPSIWPVSPGQAYISSGFGYRLDPFTGRRRMHAGLDLAGRTGTPVMATAAGIVRAATSASYIGQVVQIDHLYGYSTIYGHLSRMLVKRGQRISRGQVVGELGNTGRSTGPHLHYSVFYHNRAVDPENFLYAP